MNFKNHHKFFLPAQMFLLLIMSFSGCEHTKNAHIANQNSINQKNIYKKTNHGVINFYNKEDFSGKTKTEVEAMLGSSSLKCIQNPECEYFISSSSNHFYFQLPSVVEHRIYKICFNKNSKKVNSIEIIESKNSHVNKKFGKSLKSKENLSKGEIFKKIFESSEFKVNS